MTAAQGLFATQRHHLATHEGPYESWPLRTPLLCDQLATGATLPGYVIEAEYACEYGWLFISSYDCPFEESCHATLLSPDYQPLSSTQLVRAYDSYLLNTHWPEHGAERNSLVLHFYEAIFYRLRIHPPRFFWPRPRLSLRRIPRRHYDVDMQQSLDTLTFELARIEHARHACVEDSENAP